MSRMTPPNRHYVAAERLLAAAESVGTDPAVQTVAALAAVGHALLAVAPRRARKAPAAAARHVSPRDAWLFGADE